MREFLIGLFIALLLSMVAVTFAASLDRSVFQAGGGWWPDSWFLATLLET